MDIESMALFEQCGDGLLMCKLINMVEEGTIDERALNKKKGMNVYVRDGERAQRREEEVPRARAAK
jgi:plastin-1